MESTDEGCASTLFSLASAAAVTCGIMNPELSPAPGARNGGKPSLSAAGGWRSKPGVRAADRGGIHDRQPGLGVARRSGFPRRSPAHHELQHAALALFEE